MDARGIRNHNPLNIRKGNNWQGEQSPQTDPEFEQFLNDAYGFRAGLRIIQNGFKASPPRNTIRRIITRWAPPTENNTDTYIKFVSQDTLLAPDTRLVFSDRVAICRLVQSMAVFETGKRYSLAIINNAYDMLPR